MYKTHASPSVIFSRPAISTESIHSDNSAGQQLLLTNTRGDGNLWGAVHPQWSHSYQREAPSGGHQTVQDDHSQGSSLPSTVVDSEYEDSDSRRKRSRQERRDRHAMNMNRPDNTMYRAIKEGQIKKRAEKRKKRQEEKLSMRGRGGKRGGGGKGPTSTSTTSTGSTTVPK